MRCIICGHDRFSPSDGVSLRRARSFAAMTVDDPTMEELACMDCGHVMAFAARDNAPLRLVAIRDPDTPAPAKRRMPREELI